MPHESSSSCRATAPTWRRSRPRRARSWKAWAMGPANRLKVKVSTRDFATYRDPAVIFVDQLNKVHFDAELEVIEFVDLAQSSDQKGLHRCAQHLRRRHR